MPTREIVERFYDQVWNKCDFAAIDRLCHEELTFRGSLGQEKRGRAGFAEYVRSVTTSLGDYRCDIEDLVVEGCKAFAKMRFAGRHRAPFLGYASTNRRVQWAGAALFTIDAGQIRNVWVLGDLHGLIEQLRFESPAGSDSRGD